MTLLVFTVGLTACRGNDYEVEDGALYEQGDNDTASDVQPTNEYETDFIDVTAWGAMAKNIATHCGKGSVIAMRGRVVNRILDFPGDQSFKSIGIMGERVSFIHTKPPSRSNNPDLENNETNIELFSIDEKIKNDVDKNG